MMRNPVSTLFYKAFKENRPDSTWFGNRRAPAQLEDMDNLDGGDFCTLMKIESTISRYFCTSYYDSFYKKKLLYDLTQYDHNNKDDDFFCRLLKDYREKSHKQQTDLHNQLISTIEKDQDVLVDTIQTYLKLVQKNLTVLEFIYYFNSSDDIETSQLLKNITENHVSHAAMELYQLFNSDSFRSLNSGRIKIHLNRIIFSILDTMRYSTTLCHSEFSFTPLEQSWFLQTLHLAFSEGYPDGLDGTIPFFYLEQMIFEDLQKRLDEINSKKYTDIVPELNINMDFFVKYKKLSNINRIKKDWVVCLGYYEKALDYMQAVIEGLFDNPHIQQKSHMEIDLDNKTGFTSIEAGLPQIKELKSRADGITPEMEFVKAFFDLIKNELPKEQAKKSDALKEKLESLKKALSEKKEEINAREIAFRKELAKKNPAPSTKKPEMKKKASQTLYNHSYTAEPALTENPNPWPTFSPAPQNAFGQPTPRIPVAEQKQDKQIKTHLYTERCGIFLKEQKENNVTKEKEHFFNHACLPHPIPARFAFDLDTMNEETRARVKAGVERSAIAGDHGQGYKHVTVREKRLYSLNLENTWYKLKFSGDLCDELQIYGEIVQENNQPVFLLRKLVDEKVHKNQQRAAKHPHPAPKPSCRRSPG